MIAKLLDFKRLLIISPELLCILVVVLLFQWHPGWFEAVAASVKDSKGLPSFIGGLPPLLVVASYHLGMAILRPGEEEENRVLYQWPLYWALEIRVYSSIIICGLSTVATALFYLNPFEWERGTLGALLVGATFVAVASVLPMLVAKMQVRKIMTLYR